MDEVVGPVVGSRANPCEDKYLYRIMGVVDDHVGGCAVGPLATCVATCVRIYVVIIIL